MAEGPMTMKRRRTVSTTTTTFGNVADLWSSLRTSSYSPAVSSNGFVYGYGQHCQGVRRRISMRTKCVSIIMALCCIFLQSPNSITPCHAWCLPVAPPYARGARTLLASSPSSSRLDVKERVDEGEDDYRQCATSASLPPLPASSSRAFAGLSKFHRSILSRTLTRQRFVTGRFPLTVQVLHNNPTRTWLKTQGYTQILVNGTAPGRSPASVDRFLWLDEAERQELQHRYHMVSLELIAEIHCERPAYLHTLPQPPRPDAVAVAADGASDRERLWVTGFSLTGRRGLLKSVDCARGSVASVNDHTQRRLMWPNEVHAVPEQLWGAATGGTTARPRRLQDALLVCDGFLVPGKDRGGLRIVKFPGDTKREHTVSLTPTLQHRWFYHRAVWVDLTGDGRISLLTARCQVSVAARENGGVTSGITKTGQLVWLECPGATGISSGPDTGQTIGTEGTSVDLLSEHHLPWKSRVLARGPDVMFCVADMDPEDDTIEVITSQFFGKKVVLYSIQKGPRPQVVFERVIDENCGAAFGCILADLRGRAMASTVDDTASARVVDSGNAPGALEDGDGFSHVLVTSHECSFADADKRNTARLNEDDQGGSLYAYRVPFGKGAWKTEPWHRTVMASGFKVNGQLSNMINPGAPGLVYTFFARKQDKKLGRRPLIAIAGDCAESAYIFRPEASVAQSRDTTIQDDDIDPDTRYQLMVEIKCGATVGSIAVGYDDFTTDTPQDVDHAKLYLPCHEKDKILVFALGSGQEEMDDGW